MNSAGEAGVSNPGPVQANRLHTIRISSFGGAGDSPARFSQAGGRRGPHRRDRVGEHPLDSLGCAKLNFFSVDFELARGQHMVDLNGMLHGGGAEARIIVH